MRRTRLAGWGAVGAVTVLVAAQFTVEVVRAGPASAAVSAGPT